MKDALPFYPLLIYQTNYIIILRQINLQFCHLLSTLLLDTDFSLK